MEESSQSDNNNASCAAQPQSEIQMGGKRKTGPSEVWQHILKFKKLVDGKTKILGTCKHCQEVLPADSKSGTTNLWKHLQRKCEKSPLYGKFAVPNDQSSISQEITTGVLVQHTFNQKRCELKCVKMIIRDELPFRVVEGKGFVALLKEAQPRFKIPCRKKLASGVWDLYLMEKTKIMSVIGNRRVSLTTDTWTSLQNINYMVVTAHFMDDDWNLHKRIISFTPITSHRGEDIGRTLEACLRNWGIDKVFTITVDNVTSNDHVVSYMKKRLQSLKTLMFEGEFLHLRCACHILNLIVKDGLKDLLPAVEGIRNAVKYIHSSPARLAKFREFAILEKKEATACVPMDVCTRWNSTYKMLDIAFKYRMVFDRMSEEDAQFVTYFAETNNVGKKVKEGPPTDDDWKNSMAFVQFLKTFYDSTLKLSASKIVTSSILSSEMIAIQYMIDKKIKDSSDPILQRVATSMKIKFDKYWGSFDKLNKIVFVANVLDPRYKLQMLKFSLASVACVGVEASNVDDIVADVKICLLKLYDHYKGSSGDMDQQLVDDIKDEDDEEEGDPNDPQGMIVRAIIQQRRAEKLVEITNEVDKYLNDPFEQIKNKSFKILDWWKGNQSRYPILSKIARDVLAIPSSTVASESAFSLGSRIVDPFRCSLTPRTVEALVCCNDWLNAEDFSLYKEPTDDDVEFYKELEQIETTTIETQASSSLAY